MSPEFVLRRRAELPVSAWKNGGGRTREILLETDPQGDPLVRVSMAEVGQDGPFSPYPGVSRVLTLISGDPLVLTIDGQEHRLAVGQVLEFSGDATTQCRLTGSPVEDLGVMTWPDADGPSRPARLTLEEAEGTVVDERLLLAVVVSEPVMLGGEPLGAGDSLQVRGGEATLAGRGTVALIRR